MSKKILIVTLCLALLFSFAACKTKKGESVSTTAADTTATTAQAGEKQTTTAKQKSSKQKQTSKEEKTTKQEKGESVTKKNSDGTFTIKGVRADVVKYSGASLKDGKQLINNLIEGGLEDAKVLDKKESDNTVIYVISAKSSDKTCYYTLQYIQDGSTGYLITFKADSREALGQDLSYVTHNYKKLAR